MNTQNKTIRLVCGFLSVFMLCTMLPVKANAAVSLPGNIVGYPRGIHEIVGSTKKLWVWTDENLTNRISYEYVDAVNDQIQILEIFWDKGSIKISYPTVSKGYKTRYTQIEALLPSANPEDIQIMTATRNITTYKIADTSLRYGSIYTNDLCYVWKNHPQNDFIRVVYPCGTNAYKIAFIPASDLSGFSTTSATTSSKIWHNFSSAATSSTKSCSLTVNGTSIPVGTTYYTYNSSGTSKTTKAPSGYTYAKVGNSYLQTNGWQCCSYARSLQLLLYGVHDFNSSKFTKIAVNQTSTASALKSWIQQAGVGAHIRSSRPHSLFVIGYDNNGFYYTDANADGASTIRVGYYTWADFSSCKYAKLSYISYYTG